MLVHFSTLCMTGLSNVEGWTRDFSQITKFQVQNVGI